MQENDFLLCGGLAWENSANLNGNPKKSCRLVMLGYFQPRSQGPLSYSRERTLVEAGRVSPCDK